MKIVDKHEVRIYSGATQLEPILDRPGTITADRGWSPHVQGRIAVRPPASLASTALGALLTIELTQRFGDFALTRDLTDAYTGDLTSDLTTAFAGGETSDLTAIITAGSWNDPVRAATGRTLQLLVTRRTRSRTQHILELQTQEVVLNSLLWYEVDGNLEGLPLEFTAETAAGFVHQVYAAFNEETIGFDPADNATAEKFTPRFVDLSTPVTLNTTAHVILTGEAPFAALTPLITVSRQRLYCPGDGTVILADYPYDPGGQVTLEHGVNLLDWEITVEGLPLGTLNRFEGSAGNPAARPVHSPYVFPELNYPHGSIVDVPTIGPTIGAGFSNFSTIQAELSAALTSRVGLDESPVRLVTINDYSVMPGSSVTYDVPGQAEVTDAIDAITWQIGGEWHMDVWV